MGNDHIRSPHVWWTKIYYSWTSLFLSIKQGKLTPQLSFFCRKEMWNVLNRNLSISRKRAALHFQALKTRRILLPKKYTNSNFACQEKKHFQVTFEEKMLFNFINIFYLTGHWVGLIEPSRFYFAWIQNLYFCKISLI